MSEGAASVANVTMHGFTGASFSSAKLAVPVLDASQKQVLDLADSQSAAVIGAPGSGKTTTLIELVADRVLGRGLSPDDLLVLAPTRYSATRLRDRLATRIGVPTRGPLARTAPHSRSGSSGPMLTPAGRSRRGC